MVGVPVFFLCCSGVSSRTLLEPFWRTRMRAMKRGKSQSARTSAVSAAAGMRNEG